MQLSVLIDTYNHQQLIESAIRSVLLQDFPPSKREIIVVDDGSTDGTAEIVRQYAPQVRLVSKRNGGQASAFNAGIPECRGQVIVFLDGDDWWAPQKLRRIAQVFAEDHALGMIGHAFIESFDDGVRKTILPSARARLQVNDVSTAAFFRLSRCYFGTSRLALRANLAREILPVPEALVFEADEYLFTMAAALAPFAVLPDPLTYYRVHAGSLFLSAGASEAGERRKATVIAELAKALRASLPGTGAPPAAVETMLEIVEAEAAQLRLKLDGGWPWETFQTERTVYRVQHSDAPLKSKIFRTLSMVPALALPPRWFYAGRQWLGAQKWYKQARAAALPVPGFAKVDMAKTETPTAAASATGQAKD
ncbi:MAG TPA: glycosyltransferase family A protein [Candidatus Bathyarchaeia archaeon]|nr:glycosyltransferase family A protein [Candidatus Bathyarchaeia archaeon]